MKWIEVFLYETRPYFFLALALFMMNQEVPSPIMIASVLILFICSAFIIRFRMKARRGSQFEKIFYFAQPITYFAIGLYAIVWQRDSMLAFVSAIVLLICGLVIARWRFQSR